MGDPEELHLTVNGVEYKSLADVPAELRPLIERQVAAAREAAAGAAAQAPAGKAKVRINVNVVRRGTGAPAFPSAALPPSAPEPAATVERGWPRVVVALLVLAAAAAWLWLRR